MIIVDARKWWLKFLRLPLGRPNEDWAPFFVYFPKIVEGKLVWWQYVEIRYRWSSFEQLWWHEYRLSR